MMSHPKTVSLVLGSGGARGLAHIGVIDCLTRAGYEIQAIAGSSMGALIGGIYATGRLDTYTRWVSALERGDVIRLVDLSFGRDGLIKGDRIISVLKSLIGDANIEDLPVRFTAVATDIDNEEEVWLRDGSLFDAIRASIAMPTVFTPHRYRDRHLVDGSLVSPIPIAAVQDAGTDLTIAVNLSGRSAPVIKSAPPPEENHQRASRRQRIAQFVDDLRHRLERQPEDTLGMLDIIVKSMSIMEHTLIQAQLRSWSPDLMIEIPKNVCSFYEFHRARELIDLGARRAEAALAEWAAADA
jgi:NTE family protein